MALVKCEDCGREVSTRAAACPHCGCPITVESPGITSPAEPSPPIPEAWTERPQAAVRPPMTSVPAKSAWLWIVGGVILVFLLVVAAKSLNVDPKATKSRVSESPPMPAAHAASTNPIGPTEANKAQWAALLDNKDATSTARLEAAQELVRNFADTPEGAKARAMTADLQKAVEYDNIGRQWHYLSTEEGMTGKKSRTATVTSTNTISLDFPYSGAQHAELTLRRHPRWGNDVILSIERGQILCHTYGDCRIGVRFDDGKVMRFSGNPPSDNSSEYVFIPAFGTFMKRLPKTKTVKIEVEIYQGGSPVFEFDVSGFKPENFK